jgi:hypothetical protein
LEDKDLKEGILKKSISHGHTFRRTKEFAMMEEMAGA